jgi:hypothetical protein
LEKDIEMKIIEVDAMKNSSACQTIIDDVMLSLSKSTSEPPYL